MLKFSSRRKQHAKDDARIRDRRRGREIDKVEAHAIEHAAEVAERQAAKRECWRQYLDELED
jgi:hypothetical protein